MSHKIALIVGANGGIGRASAEALRDAGWQVRALVRTPPEDTHKDRFEWRQGDAMQAADVARAAQGASVLVHAVNPPGYRDWHKLVVPMLDNSIAAAQTANARLVLPGTLYNYGPDAFPDLREDAPQHPLTQKGKLRVQMEQCIAAATDLRSLTLRCGDFFGPHAGNNWLAAGLVQPGKPVTVLRYPGDYALPHSWAYLPDVARTLARLLAQEEKLAAHERFQFGGHNINGHEMLAALRRVCNNPAIKAAQFPWWLTAVMAPFNVTMREVREMRYLWQLPMRLRDDKLVSVLGEDLYTPFDQALRAALVGMGCLTA